MRRAKAEAARAPEVRRRQRKRRGQSSASISPTEMESYYRYSLNCQRLHSEWERFQELIYWDNVPVGTPAHARSTGKVLGGCVVVVEIGLGLETTFLRVSVLNLEAFLLGLVSVSDTAGSGFLTGQDSANITMM